MSITPVRAGTGTGTAGTASVTLGGTPAQNNLLVGSVRCTATGVTLAPAAGWAELTPVALSTTVIGALFWKIAGAGESTTQSPATVGGTSPGWATTVMEYSATATSAPVDVENSQADANLTKTSPTVTPTSSVERLVVGAGTNNGAKAWSGEAVNGSTTGVNERGDSSGLGTWDLVVASTSGSYSTTGLQASPASAGSCHIAIFKPVVVVTQDTPELYGRPFGLLGQQQMHQLLAQ